MRSTVPRHRHNLFRVLHSLAVSPMTATRSLAASPRAGVPLLVSFLLSATLRTLPARCRAFLRSHLPITHPELRRVLVCDACSRYSKFSSVSARRARRTRASSCSLTYSDSASVHVSWFSVSAHLSHSLSQFVCCGEEGEDLRKPSLDDVGNLGTMHCCLVSVRSSLRYLWKPPTSRPTQHTPIDTTTSPIQLHDDINIAEVRRRLALTIRGSP